MRKKKDKFLTVLFSFLPGAGHMYMGFMKLGISFMAAFFFTIFLSSWLDIGPLLFLVPVLWFYAFFDSINKMSASDEQFASYEDRFLFNLDRAAQTEFKMDKNVKLIAGVIFLILGAYLLWQNLLSWVSRLIPNEIYNFLSELTHGAPRVIFAVIIIVIGIRLIAGRKKEADRNA